MKNTAWSWAVVAMLAGACGGELSQAPVSPAPIEQAPSASEGVSASGVSANGVSLNGITLNGITLNGTNLNGRNLNGRELNGTALANSHVSSVPLQQIWLEGSELVSRSTSNQVLRGAALVGTELQDAVGHSLRLRIDAVSAQGDTWHYTVSYWAEGWKPLCPADEGSAQGLAAIALAGRWDYRHGVVGGGAHVSEPGMITFACVNAALGKCVRFGYAPWRQTVQCTSEGVCQSVSLAEHHQACTRMLRADYCGDGRSFTRDGMLINLYDGAGIQLDTESWATEAEWDAQGARCISQRRLGASSGPGCARNLYPTDCGAPAHFSGGTLLMSEFAPQHQ
jgi:hypothetical protein